MKAATETLPQHNTNRTSNKTGRKISKRACDGCKIRKIKCSEQPPCDGCKAVGISCTFNKKPATRGPRKLRTSTIQGIVQAQQAQDEKKDGAVIDEGSAEYVLASGCFRSELTNVAPQYRRRISCYSYVYIDFECTPCGR